MTLIDKSKPVLVTGANGYIASWLVKELLEAGTPVHAAVRNPDKTEKYKHLDILAEKYETSITYFSSDLLDEGSYEAGMEGCELVYHTASPFILNVDNPQKDLIDPAVEGTKNVLTSANKVSSVKRVVLTSSCAAIYSDCKDLETTPNNIFTEDVWNTSATLDYQPYSLSKTLAEKEAWKMEKEQKKWDLITINPSFVMGPPMNKDYVTSESMSLLKQITGGQMRFGVPNFGIGIVDVRDVAHAHYLAGYNESAEGRHIVSGHNSSFLQIAKVIKGLYGDKYPIKAQALPKWLLLLVGPLINKTLDRKYVQNNMNLPWIADHSKSIKALGLEYRSIETTIRDTVDILEG